MSLFHRAVTPPLVGDAQRDYSPPTRGDATFFNGLLTIAPIVLQLPPIPDPHRYVGLFIYDFGTHVSVGYTGGEVQILRESKEHRDGSAYQVYRVGDHGAMELLGVSDERLSAREATCFLRRSEAAARRDFDALRGAAEKDPVPCPVELRLIRCDAFQPRHTTVLCYAAPASALVARWLEAREFEGGDEVIAGTDAYEQLLGESQPVVPSCALPASMNHQDRPAAEVLGAVDRPLQR